MRPVDVEFARTLPGEVDSTPHHAQVEFGPGPAPVVEPRKEDLPDYEARRIEINARLAFLFANYFRKDSDGVMRIRRGVDRLKFKEVSSEVATLQEEGEIILQIIKKLNGLTRSESP